MNPKKSNKNASVATTKKTTKTTEKQSSNPKKFNGKYAKEITFSAQVGVKVLSSNLHMARAREVPY